MTRAASGFDDDARGTFEEEWPELSRRLDRFLAGKGVKPWLRADVVQETGIRLYARWDTLDHSLPLWNLVATIAVRIVLNDRRKESRIELVADPVPRWEEDVDVRGLQRAQLGKALAALESLTDDQRRVLLAEVGEGPLPAGTRNRINVLRLRARARLREELGPWTPSAVALRLRLRLARLAEKRATLEMSVSTMAPALVNVAIAATIGVAGTIGTGHAVASPPQPEQRGSASFAELRSVGHDPAVVTRRRERSASSRTAGDPRRVHEDASGLVPDTKDWVAYHKGWADRRRRELRQRGQEVRGLGDDGRELGEDGLRLAGEGRREGERQVDNRQEEADARRREVEARQEEVEDQLP